MRIHAIGIAAALALLGQQSVASAQSQDLSSANYIMPGCRNSLERDNYRDLFTQGVCTGIVETIFYFGKSHLGFCSPDGANYGQAKRVVIAYIDQRPERMHEDFGALALEALQKAWPCHR